MVHYTVSVLYCCIIGAVLLTTEFRYPILYCLLVLPISIVRWKDFKGETTKPAATLTVVAVLALSGVLNSILYFFTRTRFFSPATEREPAAPVIAMVQVPGRDGR